MDIPYMPNREGRGDFHRAARGMLMTEDIPDEKRDGRHIEIASSSLSLSLSLSLCIGRAQRVSQGGEGQAFWMHPVQNCQRK